MIGIDVSGKKRWISTVIFYDKDLNILVQERGTHSKSGEKYGFWGGGMKEGETPKQALRRELIEELNYRPKELRYWGTYSFRLNIPGFDRDGTVLHGELFLAPITRELLESQAEEGSGKEIMSIERVIENRDEEFGPVSTKFLEKVKKDIIQLINSSIV